MLTMLWRNGPCCALLVRIQNVAAAAENGLYNFLKMLNTEWPYNPAIILLDIYSKEMKVGT